MRSLLPESLEYRAEVNWDGKSGGNVRVGESYSNHARELKLDMPARFGGKGRFPRPCSLFFSAIGGCLLTTFLYAKSRLRLRLKGLQVVVKATVQSVNMSGYQLAGIEVVIRIETNEENRAKAEECAELTKNYSFVMRALQAGVPVKILTEIKSHKEPKKSGYKEQSKQAVRG